MTDDGRPESAAVPTFAEHAGRRAGLVQKASTDWKNALVDLGGRNNLLHYRDLKRGTLDLTTADRDAVNGLLLGKVTRVSALFSDAGQRDQVLRRVRTIHNKAKENFEERGLETLSIGCGMATWENKRAAWEPCAPVLLQPATLRPVGVAQDEFELAVVGETMEVNPTVLHVLNTVTVTVLPVAVRVTGGSEVCVLPTGKPRTVELVKVPLAIPASRTSGMRIAGMSSTRTTHDWQVRVWGYVRKPCTGHWFCQSCRDWLISEPCATGSVRQPELIYMGRVKASV